MLTFYHAPRSRSGRVHWLLHELGVPFEMRRMDVPRQDGSGARDPRNPHPEGKESSLDHDGQLATESAAIMLISPTSFPIAVSASPPSRRGAAAEYFVDTLGLRSLPYFRTLLNWKVLLSNVSKLAFPA